MQIPYYILLIVYLVIIFVFFMLAFFNLYHVIKFGLFNATARIVTFTFIVVCIVILAISWLFLAHTHWTDTFSIFGNFSNISTPSL